MELGFFFFLCAHRRAISARQDEAVTHTPKVAFVGSVDVSLSGYCRK